MEQKALCIIQSSFDAFHLKKTIFQERWNTLTQQTNEYYT